MERLRLTSITVKGDSATVYLSDGGLLDGHLITVMIDEDYRIEAIKLES